MAAGCATVVLDHGPRGHRDGLHRRRSVTDGHAIGDALRRTMHRLLKVERLQPEQVVVLSASKPLVLHPRERPLGPHRFVEAGSTQGIVAETIHRYKGLEADAVVVVVHEVGPDTPALLYVGLSQARAHLEIVSTDAVAELLSWRAP